MKHLFVMIVSVHFVNAVSSFGQSLPLIQGREYLEEQIKAKLDRIMTPDEYVFDIKITSQASAVPSSSSEGMLPGLQVLGSKTQLNSSAFPIVDLGGNAELLIVFDKNVSQERMSVARDLASRIIDTQGLKKQVKITTSQKDINKVPQPSPVPKVEKDPPFLSQLVEQKELLTNVMIVLWGGMVSLIAIYFLVKRLALGSKSIAGGRMIPQDDSESSFRPSGESLKSNHPQGTSSSTPKTGAELYSKDERFMQSIKETTDEAKENPQKIARILSRWVTSNDDTFREAALFLRNCEIKTLEAISAAMHPSELEKIIEIKIEDFEPFGNENQRAVERMRSDLAVLASEAILRDRPDPLQFLKRLSDVDLSLLLQGEPLAKVALIATQVPPHRLLKFYETLVPSSIEEILKSFANLSSVSIKELEPLARYFENKVELIYGNLLSDKDREAAALQMISSIPLPKTQFDLTEKLARENRQLYLRIRPNLLLANDFRYIPARLKSLITQTIDANTLGVSLSDFEESFEELLEGTPVPYQSVFRDSKNKKYESSVVSRSWKAVNSAFHQLLLSGLISKTEMLAIIQKAESESVHVSEAVEVSEDATSNSSNGSSSYRGAS